MQHTMKLREAPFEMIRSGAKRYELRLFDEKRQKLRVGDEILFLCGEERLVAEITELLRFPSFRELYGALPLTSIGYAAGELNGSWEDMRAYYSAEEEQRYGVLAIGLKLL
ncbi:MAG: ASCH domain-containing protein [Ruminococcaceae bacterium]|nr:ASCH domain-containing protein [Oscillospiraceae bacterium]